MTTLSSILSNIPFLRGLASSSDTNTSRGSRASDVDSIRRQAIEDTVELSPAASRSLENLDTSSELSTEEVTSLLSDSRSILETNDNVDLGADQRLLQSF